MFGFGGKSEEKKREEEEAMATQQVITIPAFRFELIHLIQFSLKFNKFCAIFRLSTSEYFCKRSKRMN